MAESAWLPLPGSDPRHPWHHLLMQWPNGSMAESRKTLTGIPSPLFQLINDIAGCRPSTPCV